MGSQLALFETPTPLPPKYCLFLGVFPSMAAVESISTLQVELGNQLGLGKKFRPRQVLHVTLHHIGNFPELPGMRIIETVGQACKAAVEGLSPFEVVFDHAMSFQGRPGNLPLVLVHPDGNAALRKLHHRLITKLAGLRLARRGDFQIVPHVTILYDPICVPIQPVAPVRWPVNEVVLVLSHSGRTRYERLQSWTLKD